jgi:hypothetical protein
MYLYGSLATDDFVAQRSDLDFVVITEGELPDPLIDRLESMHHKLVQGGMSLAKKLEGAYVPRGVIRKHAPEHPAVPTINEGKFYRGPRCRRQAGIASAAASPNIGFPSDGCRIGCRLIIGSLCVMPVGIASNTPVI